MWLGFPLVASVVFCTSCTAQVETNNPVFSLNDLQRVPTEEIVQMVKTSLKNDSPTLKEEKRERFGKFGIFTNKTQLYNGILTEDETKTVSGSWVQGNNADGKAMIFLQKLSSYDNETTATNLFKKLAEKYGKTNDGIPAKWLNGTVSFINGHHTYLQLPVAQSLQMLTLENGEVKKTDFLKCDGKFDELARWNRGLKISEDWGKYAGEGLDLFAYELNREAQAGNGTEKESAFVFVLSQDTEGSSTIQLVYPEKAEGVYGKAIQTLEQKVKQLPKWSFRQYFTAEGKLLPSRIIMGIYNPQKNLWRFREQLDRQFRINNQGQLVYD